eukprot:comp22565_c0_seq2/m.34373 comp22565_c0_seq2/g.34373  ORF comp22565_c0_seq2/g.34373 comp22565_c0_seq2/m.34373 type:complete len:194 (-) comp22565_c0_seq2:481-1062(-)
MASVLRRAGGLLCLVALIGDASARSSESNNMLKVALAGSNPCTRGPSYWCSSRDTAKSCNFEPLDCWKYCDPRGQAPMNSILCNELMSIYAAGAQNSAAVASAKRMLRPDNGADKIRVGNRNRDNLNIVNDGFKSGALGANPCTYGPSHFCRSIDNAYNCGLDEGDYEVACGRYCASNDIDSDVCEYLDTMRR